MSTHDSKSLCSFPISVAYTASLSCLLSKVGIGGFQTVGLEVGEGTMEAYFCNSGEKAGRSVTQGHPSMTLPLPGRPGQHETLFQNKTKAKISFWQLWRSRGLP